MIHEEVAFTWAQNIKPKYKKLANSEAETLKNNNNIENILHNWNQLLNININTFLPLL